MTTLSPFDFLNSINDSKNNIMREDLNNEKSYNSWIVNKGLSYFPDSIMHANEMNKSYNLDKIMQYEFYLYGVSRRKRFSKWSTQDKPSEVLSLLKEYYNCSNRKAEEIQMTLTEIQLNGIADIMYKGGRNARKHS